MQIDTAGLGWSQPLVEPLRLPERMTTGVKTVQEFEEIRLWSFECADCERSTDIAALTTHRAAVAMRSNGWIVDTTRTTCPTCATGATALEYAAAEPGRHEALVGLGGVITA